ncbi:hypothetical protein ACHAXA_006300 [Cyclostephanos tholiformis]|uniref:Uncharacterized protein n=1 Tax=Cyclostephanos tholiformis TaxID=382380 RepID=A0ABD3R890_9STRA
MRLVSRMIGREERGRLSRALKLERDCLVRLGISLGRCAEKLVRLALLDAQRMAATRPPPASRTEYIHQWAYFIGALTPALDHTEMETKVCRIAYNRSCPRITITNISTRIVVTLHLSGVGCAFDDYSGASMTAALGLRRELENMRSLMGS